jgi:hypothetical protein
VVSWAGHPAPWEGAHSRLGRERPRAWACHWASAPLGRPGGTPGSRSPGPLDLARWPRSPGAGSPEGLRTHMLQHVDRSRLIVPPPTSSQAVGFRTLTYTPRHHVPIKERRNMACQTDFLISHSRRLLLLQSFSCPRLISYFAYSSSTSCA